LPEYFDVADIEEILGRQRLAAGHIHDGDASRNVLILTLPVGYPVLTWAPAEISEKWMEIRNF